MVLICVNEVDFGKQTTERGDKSLRQCYKGYCQRKYSVLTSDRGIAQRPSESWAVSRRRGLIDFVLMTRKYFVPSLII